MGYGFNSLNGKLQSDYINTSTGWVPYWNLTGKYVGLKYPSRSGVVYYNPARNCFVHLYGDLDW